MGFGAFECKSPWKDAVRNCCGFGKGQIAVNSVLPAKTYALSPGRHWRTSAEMMKVWFWVENYVSAYLGRKTKKIAGNHYSNHVFPFTRRARWKFRSKKVSKGKSACNPPLLAATLWTYGMSKTRFLQTQKKDEDHELHTLEEHVLSVLLGDE